MVQKLFRKEKSLSEVEDEIEKKRVENDLAGTELSLAQKRVAIVELKKRGLKPSHFGFDFSKVIQWLKTH